MKTRRTLSTAAALALAFTLIPAGAPAQKIGEVVEPGGVDWPAAEGVVNLRLAKVDSSSGGKKTAWRLYFLDKDRKVVAPDPAFDYALLYYASMVKNDREGVLKLTKSDDGTCFTHARAVRPPLWFKVRMSLRSSADKTKKQDYPAFGEPPPTPAKPAVPAAPGAKPEPEPEPPKSRWSIIKQTPGAAGDSG